MTFLYPYFLLFLFVPLLFYIGVKKIWSNNTWSKVCDAHLLPYLTISVEGKENKFYKRLMVFCWILGCVCLAGPAIKMQMPALSAQSGVVVAVDMSPAMNGATTEQMTRKLYDLLQIQKDLAIGLVLADEKAYVALPMTFDNSVFQNIIPDLKENILPSVGQNIESALLKAEQLLKKSGFEKGKILLITAGVSDEKALLNAIRQSAYDVKVLGVGKVDEKQPVMLKNGRFWGAETPVLVGIKDLPTVLGKNYRHATLDDKDLKSLLSDTALEKINQTANQTQQYQNIGIYGLILLVVLVSLLFRKGVLFAFLLFFHVSSAHASIWLREDQVLYNQHQKAIQAFEKKDFETAKVGFEQIADKDISALYNLANTYAHMNDIHQAIATYEKVLKKNPNHEKARFNLAYLKEQLPPPPPQQQQSGGGEAPQSENSDEQKSDNPKDGQQNNSQSEQKDADKSNVQQNSDNPSQQQDEANAEQQNKDTKDSSQNGDETEQQQNQEDEASEDEQKQNQGNEQKQNQATLVPSDENNEKQADKNSTSQHISESQQKQQQWLDKINPDNGQILRYRLFKQYQEQQ
ncbi:MAG: VWA domain-containing protein [Alphaproteobacteria bacterium]|nr:VWA domain-containing protein [Alphaproteobacteria bacterium]